MKNALDGFLCRMETPTRGHGPPSAMGRGTGSAVVGSRDGDGGGVPPAAT